MDHIPFNRIIAFVAFALLGACGSAAVELDAATEQIVRGTKHTIHSEILGDDRNHGFTPTHAPVQGPLRFPASGGAAAYLEHVEKELRPFLDAKFRTSGSILAGWSLGGLFAYCTFLEKPELFAAYIAISPSPWWNNQQPLGWAKDRIPDGAVRRR